MLQMLRDQLFAEFDVQAGLILTTRRISETGFVRQLQIAACDRTDMLQWDFDILLSVRMIHCK